MAIDTGNGIAASFGTTALSFVYEEIGTGEATSPEVVATNLSDSKEKYLPGDIVDEGEVTFVAHFDPTKSIPALNTVEVLTLTWPVSVSGNTAATLAGSGFLTKVGRPTMVNNELQKMEMTWRWDSNGTAVAWTAEA